MPEPINLARLKAEAESADGDRCVVDRAWLGRVHEELSALQAIRERLGECFGLPQGERL